MQYDYSIIDDIDFENSDNNKFEGGLVNTESANKNIPSLIYDGPFSESVINKEIKGLGDQEYTHEEISEKLSQLFSGFSIYYTGTTEGKFSTYNYEVRGDVLLNVSVTKVGGILLTISAYGSGGNKLLTQSEGIALAESFAYDAGFDNMFMVWSQVTDNILYVNLAPIVDHVIYYSDLIKVKVDLSLGIVVGWEATGYATNHVGNRQFTSSIGILDAQELLNPLLTVEERNLAIIPDEFVGEHSAYEFICSWKNYTYYIYIDSNTGKELNILRVIDTSNGQLLE